MRLYAIENNESYRDIRKKQFNLNSQQKLVFRELFRQQVPDLKQRDYYLTLALGIPSEFRSAVWPQLVSNHYDITPAYYTGVLEHLNGQRKLKGDLGENSNKKEKEGVSKKYASEETESQNVGNGFDIVLSGEERPSKLMAALKRIELDLPRTFPDLKSLHSDEEEYKRLSNVLGSVAIVRDDVSYIQGMSQIAALLLLQLNDEYLTFVVMVNMVSSRPLYDFFVFDQQTVIRMCNKISDKIKRMSSEVWDLLNAYDIDTKIYVVGWIMTMFCRCFQLDSILSIWDILFANNLCQAVFEQLCAAIVIAKKGALFGCKQVTKMSRLLTSSKLDLIQQESVLQYMRSLPKLG